MLSRMRSWLVGVTGVLVCGTVSAHMAAAQERIVWQGGGWIVALTERGGSNVGCHTYADFQSGTRFVLTLSNAGSWAGALGEHGGNPDIRPGAIRLLVDGRIAFEGVASQFGGGGIRINGLGERTVRALSNGYKLEVISASSGSRRLDLAGSEDAIAVVRKCVAALNGGSVPPFASPVRPADNQPPQATAPTLPAPTSSTGTAFLVADRRFMTNAHVAKGCRALSVVQPGRNDWAQAILLASDTTNDLALISVPSWSPAIPVPVLRRQARLGDSVAVFGYPYGGAISASGSFTQGSVSSLTGIGNNSAQLTLTAPIQPGNSGGPVLDQNGRVIGVVVSKLNAINVAQITGNVPEGINFAVKASTAVAFLEANGVMTETDDGASARPTLSPPDLADRAAAITVMVRCTR